MKKKTAFKLRSGNKPDVEKMTGASPVKYEYFYEQPGYRRYDKYKDNPYRSSSPGYGSHSNLMNASLFDQMRKKLDIYRREFGGKQQTKELRAQRKANLRAFDT